MAPSLTTAVGRVRFALGDHDDDNLLLVGGLDQYAALLTLTGDDEAAAFRLAAGALAAYYAAQPSQFSTQGDAFTWAERVKKWTAQHKGAEPYPFTPDGEAGGATVFSAGGRRDDGYTTEGSEYAG